MKHIEAMKLALKNAQPSFMSPGWTLVRNEDIAALRQAIEQAEQAQPVAWVTEDGERSITHRQKQTSLRDGGACASTVAPFSVAAFSDPPPRKPEPLTDEQNAKRWRWAFIESPDWTYAVCKWDGKDWLPIKTEDDIKELDQAIEAAHGIGKGEA